MSPLSPLINFQTPNLFFSLLSTKYTIPPPRTLSFSQRPLPSLCSSIHFTPRPQHHSSEEEHVIGDCVVFEDGVFEDPYLQEHINPNITPTRPKQNPKSKAQEIEAQDLIPEKWKQTQKEINITKKERRKMAQELQFGSRVQKKKQGLRPIGNVGSASVEEYAKVRDEKLGQLNPVVLENPRDFRVKEEGSDEKGVEGSGVVLGGGRVGPKNPRLAVYGRSLDDVSEFFRSGDYDPNAAKKSEGPRKLFTMEDKALLNRRIPDLAAATSGKWQPLHTLAASGEFYLVDALLKHSGDINVPDKEGLTALHKAILGKKQAIFNYLLRESANPFVRDREGATLMHYAVRTTSSQMIKILLLYNVDINLQDHDGWTPLHLAVQSRRIDMVKLLLIKGADKTLKNRDGLTPLALCLYFGRDTRTYELIKLMKQIPKQRKLT